MNETDANPPPPKRSSEILWLLLAFLIAGGLFAAVFFLPIRGNLLPLPSTSAVSSDIQRRVHTLEDRVNALEARLENMPEASPAKEPSQERLLSATDLAHMQNDLAQLATAVGTVQDQMKQNGTANQALAQGALAKMIAFVQLRDAAASNRGFAHELDVMRATAKDNAALKEPLDKIAPYAEKGVPTIALLRDQLAEQISAAEVATAKANAQNWWERVLAEFRGLVLIRPLHGQGTQDSGLEAMQNALAQDDLAGALEAMKNLPAETQQVLAEWRKQAEARLAITESMQAIADHLAVSGETAPAPMAPVKDAP